MFRVWKGKGTKALKDVNFYWSILRATRGMQAITFAASVKEQACNYSMHYIFTLNSE